MTGWAAASPEARQVLLVWLGLLGLLAVEFAVAFLPVPRWMVPAVGGGMALLVALTFMRLPAAGTIAAVFAVAGLFWLLVLLGLGSLDAMTRHDIAVSPVPESSRR